MSWKFRVAAVAGAMAFVFSACGQAGEPTLSLTARPRTIDNAGQATVLTATATGADMKPGAGKVRFSAPAGSLATALEVDLANGEATASFSCDVASDPACAGGVRITAEWLVNDKRVDAVTTVTVTAPDSGTGGGGDDAGMDDAGMDAGTGGGGGTGGGMGGGGGSSDAGATLVLVPGRATIFKSVGDTTPVTATLTLASGSPGAAEDLTFSTDLGQLSLTDGGMAGTSLVATTDATGHAQVVFAETGTAGTATITATGVGGSVTGTTSVAVLEVNSITHTSTVCGTVNNCTVMGIRNSGFNETAIIKFTAKDAMGKSLAGVPVTFTANNAPSGLTISPSGVTDAMGVVSTMVQSGFSVGTFTVTATVAGTVTGTSPTIGVRGAKPSNLGFTVQCAMVNLPAYISPAPPRAVTDACTVTLIDRLGNPVGRVTSVNLNSEAGAVPANIMTTGFNPTGSNMNEGKGTFNFSTVGPFPAIDVPPLAADSAQYPFMRSAEPSVAAGALTRNPRDGLVTILAYTDGEEHFYDDNANGQRDANERFIDQGEPFLDANDNNQWDSGEFYADVDGNNMWTPPNGVWDANSKIWTVAYLLYTDNAAGGNGFFNPSTFNVARGTQAVLDVFMPDQNMNHVEAGSGAVSSRTASKGSVAFINGNLTLDGYGFGLEGRRLVNASGTGPCDATQTICTFRTLFGDWSSGYIGQLRITGAPMTDMTPQQNETVTITTTTRGVAGAASVSGIIQ